MSPSAYMDGPEAGPFPNAVGRIPIVLLLGDFLQLPTTTNAVSVAEDLLAKDPATGKYLRPETPSPEVQAGCKLFKAIQHVFKLLQRWPLGGVPDVHASARCHRSKIPAAHLGSF